MTNTQTLPSSSAGRVLRIGHRGAAGHAPENTLAAVRAGIALGVDFVELDVQRSRDGRLVVIHDTSLERTTNGSGAVAAMSWAALQSLDAGSGERVPSLEAVLAAADGRAGVMLEIKTPGSGVDVYRAVQAAEFSSPVVYASFLLAEILAIRKLDAAVKTLALLVGRPVSGAAFALEAGATLAGLRADFATGEFVAALHQAGVGVWVYTVNKPKLIAQMLAINVDGIISDFPERVPN